MVYAIVSFSLDLIKLFNKTYNGIRPVNLSVVRRSPNVNANGINGDAGAVGFATAGATFGGVRPRAEARRARICARLGAVLCRCARM